MSARVCALVVTYNRKEVLRGCLDSIRAQTRAADALLVVDNASPDGTAAWVGEHFPEAEVVAMAVNGGGAGGFHEGIRRAHAAGFDFIWLMDDDAKAAPDCLERLLAAGGQGTVTVPLQRDDTGKLYGIQQWLGRGVDVTADVLDGSRPREGKYLFAFVGPLIATDLVGRAGLPVKDFFIWFDDWEYSLRIHKNGGRVVVVPDALLHHDVGGKPKTVRILGRDITRITPAPWKLYYGARNMMYVLLRSERSPRKLANFLGSQFSNLAKDVLCEPDRGERVRMRTRGLFDGVAGRLGKRHEKVAR